MNKMPQKWCSEKLINIAEKITKGSTPTSYGFHFQNSGIRFVKVENIKNGRIYHPSIKHYISEEANNNQRRSILNQDDILFSIAGTIGNTCLVTEEDLPANTNQALALIRGTKNIFYPKFLQYQLQTTLVKEQFEKKARGGGMNNVSLRDVGNAILRIPPLNEQRRIVAKLAKLLTKVDKCKERLEKIPIILKRFRQSVLASAFSSDLTADWREKNPDIETASELLKKVKKEQKKRYDEDCVTAKKEGKKKPKKPAIFGTNKYCQYESIDTWVQLKLDYAFLPGNLFDGPFGSNLKTSDYTNNGVRVIRLENIGFLTFVENKKVFISRKKYESLKKHTVKEGDLIFASFISENVRAVVLPHIETAIAKADCFCLRPINRLINSKYLAFVLSSSQIYNELTNLVHGATRPRINTTQLKNLEIPLPPLKEQHEIVRRVEALFKIAVQIETRYQKAKAHVEKLTQSILAKAFCGELVLQDPSDSPAAELLKQIKAEREKQQAELKAKKNPQRKAKRKRNKKT